MSEPIANIKTQVIRMGWEYIRDNFHKFNETNKIKVSLALAMKDMPTQLEGGLTFNKMPEVALDDKPQELNIGSSDSSANT